jgi:hypothetical protein
VPLLDLPNLLVFVFCTGVHAVTDPLEFGASFLAAPSSAATHSRGPPSTSHLVAVIHALRHEAGDMTETPQ